MTQLIPDKRIGKFVALLEELRQGRYAVPVPEAGKGELGALGRALADLVSTLEARSQESGRIARLGVRINQGLRLGEVLDEIYDDFREIIPYDRIGLALIENGGASVRSCWVRSSRPAIYLPVGYSEPLAGSSLRGIIETGRPRIINDLVEYRARKPGSRSTALIVAEGIRSSLTCPLVANGIPTGFIFFSSSRPGTYENIHIDAFLRIAEQLSLVVEKARLVSELVEQKAEIERQNRELRRLNEQKDAFLGMAAHDLRNPIGNIQVLATLLRDPETRLTEEERLTILEEMGTLSGQMLGLLDDLLDVAEIESGTFSISPADIDIGPALRDVVQWHGRVAEAKGTCVVLESQPSGILRADPLRFRQALDNLVSNAVKFSPPGSIVRLRVEELPRAWRILVIDQGPGISVADRAHLFEDFARLSAKPTAGERSTGLGLAISRRVVEAHHGRIGVDSVPGHGATFWIELPRNPSGQDDAAGDGGVGEDAGAVGEWGQAMRPSVDHTPAQLADRPPERAADRIEPVWRSSD